MYAILIALALTTAEPPTEADLKKRAELLVEQLGDKDYRDRERAAKNLLEIGYPAKAAVFAGQQSGDHEISERCRRLYPVIWRQDLDKRIQKFFDNPDAANSLDLPGATRWLKLAGDSKASRELYGEVVRAHAEPLLEAELHPDKLKDVFFEFMKNVYARIYGRRPVGTPAERPMPTDAEVLLFLFLGAAGDVRPATTTGISSTHYYQFLNSPYLAARLAASPADVAVRGLFAGWLENERYSLVMRRGLDLAAQHGVKECAPIALRIAKDATTTLVIRSSALLGFAKLGAKDLAVELEPFLRDKTPVGGVVIVNGQRGNVQMRDVALAAAVQLAGQSLADFGFERKPPAGIASISTYTYYAFGTDEKREAAHAKWKEWAEKNQPKK